MPGRRVLVIDEDKRFPALIRGWLVPYGFEVHGTGNDGLAKVSELKPDVIFIAVDLPDKEGFTLFSKAKRLAQRVPFVLSTATISQTDLKMHKMLRVHADVYLDKRTLTKDELLPILDELIGLGPGRSDLEEAEDDADEGLLPSGLGGEEGTAPGQASTTYFVEPENELDRLRWELEQARRAAAASPYARDYLSACDVARQREKEAIRLRQELHARERELGEVRKDVDELAKTFTGRLLTEVQKVRGEAEALRQQYAAQAREAVQALELEQRAHRETRQDYESKLAEFEAGHANIQEDAQQEHAVALAALEDKLRKVKAQAVEAVEALMQKVGGEAEALRRQHAAQAREAARALEQEQRAHDETRQDYESKLAEFEAGHADVRRQAEQERAAALAALETKRQKEKAQAVAAVEAQCKEKLDKLRHQHAGALSDRQKINASLDRAIEDYKRDLSDKDQTINSLKAILVEKGIFLD